MGLIVADVLLAMGVFMNDVTALLPLPIEAYIARDVQT